MLQKDHSNNVYHVYLKDGNEVWYEVVSATSEAEAAFKAGQKYQSSVQIGNVYTEIELLKEFKDEL